MVKCSNIGKPIYRSISVKCILVCMQTEMHHKCLFTNLSHLISPFDGLKGEDGRSSGSDADIFTLTWE